MKHIQISDDAYAALANRHGDVAAFIEQVAQREQQAEPLGDEPKSFYDAMNERGLIGCIQDAPPDLSTNPKHMEGFGE